MKRLKQFLRRSTARDQIELAAADWVARRDGGLAPEDETALARWQDADPRHREAFAESERIWRLLNAPHDSGRSSAVLRTIAQRREAQRRHRVRFVTGGALAALVVLAWGTFARRPSASDLPTEPTVTIRPDHQVLPDGSVVEINAGAEIAVAYTSERREVRLLRGEALFSVKHNPARPFVVVADGVAVRAVGTAFVVRAGASNVNVLVTEGKVAVERAADGLNLIEDTRFAPESLRDRPVVKAGQRVAISVADQPSLAVPAPVSGDEISAALAWRQRRVEFSRSTLAEAAALFNRENTVKIELADDLTSQMRISGVFWTDDPEGFSRLLASVLGLTVTRTEPERITLRK